MENKSIEWDADWDDVIDPSEPPESDTPMECAVCGCLTKPDEWSSRVKNCCFDCA